MAPDCRRHGSANPGSLSSLLLTGQSFVPFQTAHCNRYERRILSAQDLWLGEIILCLFLSTHVFPEAPTQSKCSSFPVIYLDWKASGFSRKAITYEVPLQNVVETYAVEIIDIIIFY